MNEKLVIKAEATGKVGQVSIIGDISEWSGNNAVDFRAQCQSLVDAGVTSCLVYLVTYGGDVFQANEMVNILDSFFPNGYDGEGGAVVASAGTYIAVHCKTFTLANNGQFMVHKPSGGAYGNEQDVQNFLTLLQNLTTTYYASYVAKLKKPEADFKTKWDAGDLWLTAHDAQEWGFITGVKAPAKIDTATAQAIRASGSPIDVTINNPIINKIDDMDLKAMARSLGLPETASEEQISAKAAETAQKAKDYDTLKAQTDRENATKKAADIKALLDGAEKDKRINAETYPKWQKKLEEDFAGTKELIDGLNPVIKLSGLIKTSVDGKGATYNGKTFEQLQGEDPEALAELEANDPDAFASLFADWKTRNKIK
jgi:ATP-dependent protease ClpP protease subunit